MSIRKLLLRSTIVKLARSSMITLAAVAISCGGSSVQGTYTNANGAIVLELKSGGEASLSMLGEKHPCTYKQESAKVMLTCQGSEALEMAVQGDGSLSAGPIMGSLKKSK